jgi:nicotinamide-nucleotide amidase
MPAQNSKQAWLIPSAEALPNPMGTAPGWFVRRDNQVIVTMPGVPREMRRMWREQAVPRLTSQLGDQVFVSTTLKTIGIGESAAEREIAEIIHRGYPVVATYAKDDGVHIRIVASAATREPAEAAVQRTEAEIREVLAEYVYGEESTSLGSAMLAPLVASGDTLSLAESGASGRITELIAEEPAAVVHFAGGMVRAFEHSAAQRGIDMALPDAARLLAASDADAVKALLRSDYGFAVAVRLTPGATFDATHGDIALCLSGRHQRYERQHTVKSVPSEVRRRAALWGAEFLRSSLLADTAARR